MKIRSVVLLAFVCINLAFCQDDDELKENVETGITNNDAKKEAHINKISLNVFQLISNSDYSLIMKIGNLKIYP